MTAASRGGSEIEVRHEMCSCGHTRKSHTQEGCWGCGGPECDAEQEVLSLADALAGGDELAYDNMHAPWARESIARTILSSRWFANRVGE